MHAYTTNIINMRQYMLWINRWDIQIHGMWQHIYALYCWGSNINLRDPNDSKFLTDTMDITGLHVIFKISNYLNEKCKMILHNTLIMKNFNYCNTTWDYCIAGDTLKLKKIRKRALRIIFNDYTKQRNRRGKWPQTTLIWKMNVILFKLRTILKSTA